MTQLLAAGLIEATAGWCIPVLLAAILIASYRLLRGPDAADRVLALDLMSTLAAGVLILRSIVKEEAAYLDIAIVIALVTFMATVGFARYMSEQVSREE